MLKIFAHWQLPLICALVWWAMLIAMLGVWSAAGRPDYRQDRKGVTLVYISDIGGYVLKALFIPCAAVQGVFFILSLAAERYLRHAGRLPRNMRRREKVFAGIAIFLSIPGEIGILLVAVFDEINHKRVHYSMLVMFLCCIGFSVFFTILEFFYLDKKYPDIKRLRVSYVLKAIFLAGAIILAIGFGVSSNRHKRVVAAVFEWFLAFWYGMYLLILAYDLFPAFRKNSNADYLETQADKTISDWWLVRRLRRKPNDKYDIGTSPDFSADADPNYMVNDTYPIQSSPQQMGEKDPMHPDGWTPSFINPEVSEKNPIGDLVYQNRRSYLENENNYNNEGHYQNQKSHLDQASSCSAPVTVDARHVV